MTESTPQSQADHERDLRQLALIDRIIGLEAEVAHLRSLNVSSALKEQLKEVKSSTTWKVGRLVLSPAFAIQSITGGRKKRQVIDDDERYRSMGL